MKQLVVLLLCFVSFLSFTNALNCAAQSGSCAKCMQVPGCQYVWYEQGLYNSPVNASCIPDDVFKLARFANQYKKTIWAYALPEVSVPGNTSLDSKYAVNSTMGQYLLTKIDSSKNYGAQAVPCFDRQLCYCKPMPPPPPSTLIFIIRDATTLAVIGGASLNTTVANGTNSLTDLLGQVIFDPVDPSGGYQGFACAPGYKCNVTLTPAIGTNQTVTVTILLEPLPCVLRVLAVLDATNAPLKNVVVTTTGFADKTTADDGLLQYSLTQFPSAGTVSGVLSGFQATPGSFSCDRGGSQNVTLRFKPLPNIVIVTVLDARTLDPIPTAFVTLTVTDFPESPVDGKATTQFTPVFAGNYVARGRADGYNNNQTSVPTLTTNSTVHVYVYLTELKCNVHVKVVTTQDVTVVVPGASVVLNVAGSLRTSDANGVVDYSIFYNDATRATGSKASFKTNSTDFTCTRGANVTVIVYLKEVLTVILAAQDAKTQGNPVISNATIYWNGVLVPVDPVNDALHYLEVESLPIIGEVRAQALGFNDQIDSDVKFTMERRNYTISLAPQEFTLYFVPVELIYDTTQSVGYRQVPISSTGFVENNYFTVPGEEAQFAYQRKPIQVGGSAQRATDPPATSAYNANSDNVAFNGNTDILTAKYGNVSPPPQDTFYLQNTGLSGMNPNWDKNRIETGNIVLIPVPLFSDTPNRQLVVPVPFYLTSGFLVIRATPTDDKLKVINFGQNDFMTFTVIFAKGSQFVNYPSSIAGNKPKAIFEFPIAFNTRITDIQAAAPLQTYNMTRSNFADPDITEAIPLPDKTGPLYKSLVNFTFTLLQDVMDTNPSTLQRIRHPERNLYLIRDYVVVKQVPVKKRSD